MMFHYVKAYYRQPPLFQLESSQIFPVGIHKEHMPEGLMEIRGKPYQDLENGWAWITYDWAQQIFFDEQGKITHVNEYFEHYWMEPFNRVKGYNRTLEQEEAYQMYNSLFRPVYHLPEEQN